MANYRRLISYIYAYEGGIKGKNVGFAKLEVRNGQCKLQVNVRNVYIGSQDTGVFLLCGQDEILVGKIFIRNGAGEFRAIVPINNVAGSGQSIDKCYGLTVHNLTDSWQSYTTIWEDAVTHAAEVVLEEAASEQMEKKEAGPTPVSAPAKEKEESEEPLNNSIADAIEAEIEAQSRKSDPVPSSTIPPAKPLPPQFLRPAEMEVMEVKPLETVSPIGGELGKKEDNKEGDGAEAPTDVKTEGEGEPLKRSKTSPSPQPLPLSRTRSIPSRQQTRQQQMPQSQARSGPVRPSGISPFQKRPSGGQGFPMRSNEMPSSQGWISGPGSSQPHPSGLPFSQPPQPQSAHFQSDSPGEGWWSRSDWNILPASKENMGQSQPEVMGMEQKPGEMRPETVQMEWESGGAWSKTAWPEQGSDGSRPEAARPEQESGGSGSQAPQLDQGPDGAGPEAARPDQESGESGPQAPPLDQRLSEASPEAARPDQESGGPGSQAPQLDQRPGGPGSEAVRSDQGSDVSGPEAAGRGRESGGSVPEAMWPDQKSGESGPKAMWPNREWGASVSEAIWPDRESGASVSGAVWLGQKPGETEPEAMGRDQKSGASGPAAKQPDQEWGASVSEEVWPDQKSGESEPGVKRPDQESGAAEPGAVWPEQESGERGTEPARTEPESLWMRRNFSQTRPKPGQRGMKPAPSQPQPASGRQQPESGQPSQGFGQMPPQSGQTKPGYSRPGADSGQPQPTSGQVQSNPGQPQPEQERLEEEPRMDTVWQHFYNSYPKIQAFDYNGGCDILTIKPQDIGLLPREVWGYGNNSFLLHGYYSHRYLILARLNNPKGDPRFLLGVPGHYYSNEKYMAAMFGFPNFVLSKIQPAGDGRFGYWYTDIRLGYSTQASMRT